MTLPVQLDPLALVDLENPLILLNLFLQSILYCLGVRYILCHRAGPAVPLLQVVQKIPVGLVGHLFHLLQ